MTGRLLRRLAASGAQFVLAEKPWFRGYDDAVRVAPLLGRSRVRFAFLDHYLYRPLVRWLLTQPIEFFLGGPIMAITGWLLESSAPTSPAMRVGVLSDLLIHLVTLSKALLPGCPIDVTGWHAARYTGAPSKAETFAHLEAVASSIRPVPIALSAAKNFPAEAAGKMLLIQGPAATLRLNLGHDTAELVTDRETRPVFPSRSSSPVEGAQLADEREDAYRHIVRRLGEDDRSLGLSLDEALAILRILKAARDGFPDPLPAYDPAGFPPTRQGAC